MASYVRKTKDVWCIETNCGYGWDEECRYDDHMDAVRDLKEYRLYISTYGGRVRIVKRRERL